MKCSKCRFVNPEGMKFCVECGDKLEIICPNCGFVNFSAFKFCGECGQNLTLPIEPVLKDLSPDEKLEKIQKYLPKGIAEKILAQRDRIEGERKQVTVMFCDMEGFTPFADRFGPEETYAVMDQVYEILIHKVHDYEGTVNEMTGDGIMALFGAPIALEDAPQRAIRSALAIHREMARFNDRMKLEKPEMPPLKMRVGIHTGPVIVGTLGNDLRVEFKAVGDTVNLASRMEGLAEPGTTYASDDTFKLTEGFFRFEAFGERKVKGKEDPVNVFRIISPSTRRTRFDVSTEQGLTQFVGRDRELEIMLDCLERAKMGRGQAVSIVSEAGIGKSRLLYEFRKAIVNEDVTFFEGRCLSYSRGVPFHSVIDVLKSYFDIKEEDSDELITYYKECKMTFYASSLMNSIADIFLNIDEEHISKAEDWIKKSINHNERYGMKLFLAHDYALYAELFKRKSEQSKVKENLTKGVEIFKECGADGWVKRYEKELGALS